MSPVLLIILAQTQASVGLGVGTVSFMRLVLGVPVQLEAAVDWWVGQVGWMTATTLPRMTAWSPGIVG